MSAIEDKLVHIKYQMKIWKILGILPPDNKIYYIPIFIFHFITSFMFLSTMIVGCVKAKSFEEFSWSLSFTMSVGCSAIRNLPVLRWKKALSVADLLEKLNKRAHENSLESRIVEDAVLKSRKLFKMLFLNFICSTSIFELIIVFVMKRRMLFMPAWMPFDWKNNSKYYILAHVFQYGCILGQATMASVIDTLPSGNLIIMRAHIESLGLRTSRIGWDKDKKSPNKELISCIKDHKNLLQLFQDMFSTITTSLMILVMLNAATQCAFVVSIVNTDLESGIVLTLILMCSTFQTFIPCYFADNMRYESEMLVNAIGCCNWVDQNLQFKRALLFFILRAQKPFKLLAGGYVPIALNTFLQIQKMAYSMFVLIKK